jgi:hypothetical protein
MLSSLRRCSIHRHATAPFIVAPPVLPLCRAAAAFFVTPPFPSLSRRWFCLRHRAAASSAFVVAPPLPSLSRRCCCHHRAAARFIIAPPLYFLISSHLDRPQIDPIALPLRPRQVSHSPLFVAVTSQSPPIVPPLPSSPRR